MTRLALTLAAARPAALLLPSAAAALIQVDRGIGGGRETDFLFDIGRVCA
jgi:hypothetical protein